MSIPIKTAASPNSAAAVPEPIVAGFRCEQIHALCQIQDLGRFGAAQFGLSQGGAVDWISARLANALVGNQPNTAVLEVALGGLSLRATAPLHIAVTGAAMTLLINGKPTARYMSIQLQADDLLQLSFSKGGCRCYLAVSGGFVADACFGSVATVLREQVGGIAGKALSIGQLLPVSVDSARDSSMQHADATFAKNTAQAGAALVEVSLDYTVQYQHKGIRAIPFVAGAQASDFAPALLLQFQQRLYRVSAQADRMGIRLQGPPLAVDAQPLLSEGICLGAIQLPPDGLPIVMLNDHQTIGGYPKLGAVTAIGVAQLGQCQAGDLLRFVAMSTSDAAALRHALEQQLQQQEHRLLAERAAVTMQAKEVRFPAKEHDVTGRGN